MRQEVAFRADVTADLYAAIEACDKGLERWPDATTASAWIALRRTRELLNPRPATAHLGCRDQAPPGRNMRRVAMSRFDRSGSLRGQGVEASPVTDRPTSVPLPWNGEPPSAVSQPPPSDGAELTVSCGRPASWRSPVAADQTTGW